MSLVNESDETLSEPCARPGISRKTGTAGRTPLSRGAAGRAERRPVALTCPRRTTLDMLNRIIELRKEHPR